MRRVRGALAAAAVGAALAAQHAPAQAPPSAGPPIGGPLDPTLDQGAVSPQPPHKPPKQKRPKRPKGGQEPKKEAAANEKGSEPKPSAPKAVEPLACGPTGVPLALVPIYSRAAERYRLGPSGASILAAINEIETGFGANLGPSSAGAVGWMQFMPATWEAYGVDANGDGRRDPNDPEDAIFAAANYLSASGMPEDVEGAIFAYNHADWYVADVLARARCFGGLGGGSFNLLPERPVLECTTGRDGEVPAPVLAAGESAAARYDLGARGVWTLAAIARLETNFGRSVGKASLRRNGIHGLDGSEWKLYGADGDGDGRISPASIADSSATLAREIWSQGELRAGVFEHNQASWYVDEVLDQAGSLAGSCEPSTSSFAISLPGPTGAGIRWDNLELTNPSQLFDIRVGAVDPRILGLIGAITQEHRITISSLRSDHSMHTNRGSVSNHYYGRAIDIAAVDGVPCTVTAPNEACGSLASALSLLSPAERPSELIYCFDVDAAGPAFAQADHCDHIHAGFDD